MQRVLLLNALASMVALAVAYPMSGEMMAVAKREEEAIGAYLTNPYDEDKKRGKYSWPSPKMRLLVSTSQLLTTTRNAATEEEEEAIGAYLTNPYDEDKKRGKSEDEAAAEDEATGMYFPLHYDDKKRGKFSWLSPKMRLLVSTSRSPTMTRNAATEEEEEAIGAYLTNPYDEDKKRAEDEAAGVYFTITYDDKKRGKYSWPSATPRC
ncbi:hypothetical protein EDD22DRAFT_965633 [Suillus occidentalis]|nr:hypothetical protein EDD22DRAFT_965633 [Suillus occidentalis]